MGLFDYDATASSEAEHGEIVFLEDFSSEDWKKILNIVETRHFHSGQDLVRDGEKDDSFYILSSGTVEIIVRDAKGNETALTSLPEGSVFGEIALRRPTAQRDRTRKDGRQRHPDITRRFRDVRRLGARARTQDATRTRQGSVAAPALDHQTHNELKSPSSKPQHNIDRMRYR